MSAQQSKPRSDSRLKTLPEERQDQIAELLRTKSLKEVRAELAKDGVRTSEASLSDFYSWWKLQRVFRRLGQNTETMQELLRQDFPDVDEARISAAGARFFNLQAIETENPELFLGIQTARHKAEMDKAKLELRKEQLALNRQKFQRETAELFLNWFRDQRAREIAQSSEPNDRKINRLGELMFGEDWQ